MAAADHSISVGPAARATVTVTVTCCHAAESEGQKTPVIITAETVTPSHHRFQVTRLEEHTQGLLPLPFKFPLPLRRAESESNCHIGLGVTSPGPPPSPLSSPMSITTEYGGVLSCRCHCAKAAATRQTSRSGVQLEHLDALRARWRRGPARWPGPPAARRVTAGALAQA